MKVPLDRKGPRGFPPPLKGGLRLETLESRVLRGNPLGDPTERKVAVYTPPSGVTEGKPLLLWLPGFAGAGWMTFRAPGFLQEGVHERFERLVKSGDCGEAVIVSPDCLTSLGGSQYVNSTATGAYQDHVLQEVLPWARERFRTGRTGVLGQSSGGFGALHLAFEHPELFDAVGSSAGDMGFEYSFLPDFPKCVRVFRRYGGPEGFLAKLFEDPQQTMPSIMDPAGAALSTIAMAACYSPTPGDPGSFELPFDPEDGRLRPEVWERWLAFDPVRRVRTEAGASALKRMRLVHVTASSSDEWASDATARWFVSEARARGVRVVHDEFEGGHFLAGPRYEAMLTKMVRALTE